MNYFDRDSLIQKYKQLVSIAHFEARNILKFLNQKYIYENPHWQLQKRQRFCAQAGCQVRGLFILGLWVVPIEVF